MKNDFEYLLQRNEDISRGYTEIAKPKENKVIHKSNKSANLYDFIKMIDRLVTLTMKDENVKLIPFEGKVFSLDAMKSFDNPLIAYKIKSREPKGELKPRIREYIKEEALDGEQERFAEVWGQRFKCEVQFDIICESYNDAEKIMKEFEDIIVKYTGYFKKNGVAEIVFKKQFEDESETRLREILSVRNLLYYVEIENLTVIFKEKIEEVSTILNTDNEEDIK